MRGEWIIRLRTAERWLGWTLLAVLFLRPEVFHAAAGPVKISLTTVRNLVAPLFVLFAVRRTLETGGRVWRPAWNAGAMLLAVFAVACLAGLFKPALGVNPVESLGVVAVYAMFFRLSREWWAENEAGWDGLIRLWLVCAGITAVCALGMRFWMGASAPRIIENYPFWPGKNFLGLFMALSLLTALGWLLGRPESRADRALAGGVFAVSLAALVCSYSRGAWVAGILGLCALWVWTASPGRRWVRVAGVACALAALAVLIWCVFPHTSLARRIRHASPEHDEGVHERLVLWKGACRMIADHPLTGVGLGRFDREHRLFYRSNDSGYDWKETAYHAHNLYLQVAAEVGLPGAAGLFGFLFLAWLAGARAARASGAGRREVRKAWLSGLAAIAVYGLFDSTFNARYSHASMFHINLVALLMLAALAPVRAPSPAAPPPGAA